MGWVMENWIMNELLKKLEGKLVVIDSVPMVVFVRLPHCF